MTEENLLNYVVYDYDDYHDDGWITTMDLCETNF
jgi:hypothetical protein